MERAPAVEWRDLAGTSPGATVRELLIPLPWLLLSWGLYASPLWRLGSLASFMFFLCALRLNHEAIHGNLGLSRRGDRWTMHALSMLMLGSNHADACCHLQHHRAPMSEDDHEGSCGRMTLWEVLRYGPRFPLDLLRAAWAQPRWRGRVATDLALVAAWLALVVALGWRVLWLHVAAMALAQCLAALFAVWTTHRGCDEAGLVARSQRGPLAWLAYQMFYHREHHLFPAVPVRHLPALARRLDAEVPGYAEARLPILPLWEGRA